MIAITRAVVTAKTAKVCFKLMLRQIFAVNLLK